MKHGGVSVWMAVTILLSMVPCRSEEPQPASPWSIRSELLIVQVPQKVGLTMRARLKDNATIVSGLKELIAMIDKGTATLVGTAIAWSSNGKDSTSDTVEEVRYPTEFDPPHPPQNFGPVQKVEPDFRIEFFHLPSGFNVPIAFETRNTGVSLELSAVASENGRSISLNLVSVHNRYLGLRTTPSSEAKDWRYKQPQFRTRRITTGFVVRSGAWNLIDVDVLHGSEPTIEFTLFRGTAIAAKQ